MSGSGSTREMSAAELGNAFWKAFNERGIDAASRYLAPDVVAHSAPGWPGKAVYEGHDGARELDGEWRENFDDYRWDPAQTVALDDRKAVLLANHSGRSRAGVPTEGRVAGVFETDGRLINRIRFFFSWEEALVAAGSE